MQTGTAKYISYFFFVLRSSPLHVSLIENITDMVFAQIPTQPIANTFAYPDYDATIFIRKEPTWFLISQWMHQNTRAQLFSTLCIWETTKLQELYLLIYNCFNPVFVEFRIKCKTITKLYSPTALLRVQY